MRWIAGSSVLVGLGLALGAPAAPGAISPENVLVLYNPSWSDGTHNGDYVANYYAGQRGIPTGNVVGLTGLGVGVEISATDYLKYVRPQVQAALNGRTIDVIVTTTGIPLRIRNDLSNPDPRFRGHTYTDTSGGIRDLYGDFWSPYSSLESELAGINSTGGNSINGSNPSDPNWLNSALLQMGDHTFYRTSPNPYCRSTTAFSHADAAVDGMYLTARLDGFTAADVTSAIDRASSAFVLPKYNLVVADNAPSADVTDYNMVQRLRDNVLAPKGMPCVYDNTSAAVTAAPGGVLGYVSHGTHGSGLNPGYIPNQLKFTLSNGAVFLTHESYNAYSFQPGGNLAGQGLVAEWLAKGGTAGVGNVQEPYNGPSNEANEDQIFQMLLDGYTWGEAAWSSLAQLSYVNTVVGDPLMTWRQAIPGDANLDGTVDAQDLDILKAHLGATGPPGLAMWRDGDFNADGRVDGADQSILGENWGRLVPSQVESASTGARRAVAIVPSSAAIPEPCTGSLASGVLLFLLALGWRRRRMREGAGAQEDLL